MMNIYAYSDYRFYTLSGGHDGTEVFFEAVLLIKRFMPGDNFPTTIGAYDIGGDSCLDTDTADKICAATGEGPDSVFRFVCEVITCLTHDPEYSLEDFEGDYGDLRFIASDRS